MSGRVIVPPFGDGVMRQSGDPLTQHLISIQRDAIRSGQFLQSSETVNMAVRDEDSILDQIYEKQM